MQEDCRGGFITVQDITDEVRQICQETDPNSSHATDAVILGWINAATLSLCASIATLPKVSVAGQVAAATITLPTNLLRMDFASITDGTTHFPLETIDFVNFVRINPGYENQPTSKPNMLVRMTDLNWTMYPNPDATWTGKALTIIGSVLPTPLTSPNDSPALSITLHPAYSHFCAWKFFLLLNNPERAGAEYSAFDGLRKQNVGTATSTTGSQLCFKIRGM